MDETILRGWIMDDKAELYAKTVAWVWIVITHYILILKNSHQSVQTQRDSSAN